MVKSQQSANKNKSSAASKAKSDRAAAKKAAKDAEMEQMWAPAEQDEEEEGGGAQPEPQVGGDDEDEEFTGDPFEMVEEFDGDSQQFGRRLFGGLDKSSKVELANSTNRKGVTLLHTAVECEVEALIPVLLANGADVNQRDKRGKTALHLALEQGSEAAASALLAAGDLDVKSYDKGGTSLLISSLSSQMWGVSKQLLGRGADPSRADRQKTAPLHALCAACAGGSYSAADDGVDLTAASEVLHDMMGRGADINVQTYDGRTPLMIAAGTSDRQTREALVKLLLTELGADPKLVSRTGHSCADAAQAAEEQDGTAALTALLVEQGAPLGQGVQPDGAPAEEDQAGGKKRGGGNLLSKEDAAEKLQKAVAATKKANAGKSQRKKKAGAGADSAQETMDSVLRICGMLAAVLAVLVPISIYLDPGGPDPSRV